MEEKYCYKICVADTCVAMYSKHPIKISEKFQEFYTVDKKEDYEAFFEEVYCLPELGKSLVYKGLNIDIYEEDGGQYKACFRDAIREQKIYAVSSFEWEKKRVIVKYLPEKRTIFSTIENCIFHIEWELMLLRMERIILHASCVKTKDGGILFSGPSGIGKSTQANLWCQYAGAKLLNGDRPVVCKKNEQWKAYGSPYAGSSKCYINDSCNVDAIIVLKQSSTNEIRRLGKMESFQKIFRGVTVNSWDLYSINKATDLVISIIEDIPIYEFYCTPSEEAVAVLKSELSKGKIS